MKTPKKHVTIQNNSSCPPQDAEVYHAWNIQSVIPPVLHLEAAFTLPPVFGGFLPNMSDCTPAAFFVPQSLSYAI